MSKENKVSPGTLRALRSEVARLRGGHQRELQKDLEQLSEQGARQLLGVIRDLESERDSERRKRRMGLPY